MDFYGLAGYGYTPAFPYENRTSSGPYNRPGGREAPILRRISTRLGNKVRRFGPERNDHVEGQKSRIFQRLTSWLSPRRWIRQVKVKAARSPGAPVIPPINVGDRLFLESLVRHAEDYSSEQPRTSTLPLLHRPSNAPTIGTIYGSSMPYDVISMLEDDSLATNRCHLQPIDRRLVAQSTTDQEQERASSPRTKPNLLLLRSPHPPSSYQGVPFLGVTHSRQSSQSACSAETSCYDPQDFRIGSLSESVLSGTTSPLFYRPNRDSTPTTPASTLPSEQNIRHRSLRISSLPDPPAPRAGSLTVSIRTEEGMENLEFPSPPRWSGCWFSDRANNRTPMPPGTPFGEDGGSDGSESYGEYNEDEDDIEATMAGLTRVPEASQESLTASITESGASTSSSSRLPIPHMRTFGPDATSFLSLNAHFRAPPTPMRGDAKPPVPLSSIGSDRDSGMNSVCSAFADVSLSSGADFDENDPISDADSFTDPCFLQLR